MEEIKQYEIFQKLMLLSLEDPNAIYNVAMKILLSMSKLNNDSEEEFEKTLDYMRENYKEMESLDELIKKVILMKEVLDL